MASIAFSPCAQCATVCSSSIISVRTERIELVLPRTLHFSLCRWQAPSTSRACLVEPVQVVPAGSVHGDTTMMGDPFCRLLDSHMFLLFSHDRARIDNFAVKVSSGGAQTSVSAQSTGAQSHAVATQKFLTTASMVVRGVRSGCWGSLSLVSPSPPSLRSEQSLYFGRVFRSVAKRTNKFVRLATERPYYVDSTRTNASTVLTGPHALGALTAATCEFAYDQADGQSGQADR